MSKADVSATSVAGVVAEKIDAPTAGDAENVLLVRQFGRISQRVQRMTIALSLPVRWISRQCTRSCLPPVVVSTFRTQHLKAQTRRHHIFVWLD